MKAPIVAAPCGKCPFRTDVPIYLRAERREQIARSLLVDGADFHCHEHTVYDDESEQMEVGVDSPMCAGAAKALLNRGGSTNTMRVVERLGMVDLDRIRSQGAEVWDLDVWPKVPERETAETWDASEAEEVRTCETVDSGCLAPAGYLGEGGVIRGTESADGECAECGDPLCSNCADEEGLCGSCREWGDDDD